MNFSKLMYLGRTQAGAVCMVAMATACQAGVSPSASGGGQMQGGGGGINPPAGGAGGTAGGGLGGAGGAGGSGPVDCSQPHATPTPLRPLTPTQYDWSMLDIVKVAGEPSTTFSQGSDDVAMEQRAETAAAIAADAAANLADWAPCTPVGTDDVETCQQQIINVIGSRYYRHPISEAEFAQLKTLFDAGIAAGDFSTGVEWFLTGIIQSPDFMYEIVRPDPTEVAGEVRPLSPHELATRLAFFLWDSPPDEALLSAATNNELGDPNALDAQVARMMEDPRFERGIAQFYSRWLSMKTFEEVARDAEGFDGGLVEALSTSLLMSATELYRAPNPNISELFSGDSYYMNDVMRDFYGLSGAGSEFTATPMSGEARQGILTHPAMMALLARPNESFPIGRGLHVLRNILCQVIEAPVNIMIPPQPPLEDGVSTRERLEMHTSSVACQGCHSMINPIGFAFESFDEVGRFRSTDHGRPVDTSGSVELGMDIDGPFATGQEFLARLGTSSEVRACFAEKYVDFAIARTAAEESDGCVAQGVGAAFVESGDLKQLVSTVASSDALRTRLAVGVGQ